MRLNTEKLHDAYVAKKLEDPDSLMLPIWNGNPLVIDRRAGFLSIAARSEFGTDAPLFLLGEENGTAYFTIDASNAGVDGASAPFGDIGEYMDARAAASILDRDETAIYGHGRWLLEWARTNPYCTNCGAKATFTIAGAKQTCAACDRETFPRTAPVSIVLAIYENTCLLGRGPQFPPNVLSALAGFVEPAETPEEAARRELFEEAGIKIGAVHYQFSQPWPFPNSMMMGFIAEALTNDLTLDEDEIVEARWIEKNDIQALLAGETRDFFIPPKFTIARQLLERWAANAD